ncbi:hypothetical protein P355_0417 [Burkholderia cenocepacia KC-01]|nr:hypothetical protein P355_0417 [Burkholderia cenocepacia KC-01]
MRNVPRIALHPSVEHRASRCRLPLTPAESLDPDRQLATR